MAQNKLTAKQQVFVNEYLIDLNATQAAIRAGYSKKGAAVRGSELLTNRKVAAAVSEARMKLAERNELTIDGIIQQLREDREFARALENPATAARVTELLGKYLGMFVERHETKSHVTLSFDKEDEGL